MSRPCNLCHGKGTYQRDPDEQEAGKLMRRLRGQPAKTKLFIKEFCHCKVGQARRKADEEKERQENVGPLRASTGPDGVLRINTDDVVVAKSHDEEKHGPLPQKVGDEPANPDMGSHRDGEA